MTLRKDLENMPYVRQVTTDTLGNEQEEPKKYVDVKSAVAEETFEEKVERILIKELEAIERDMGRCKVIEEEFPGLTPMQRVDYVVGIYNRLHNKGGNGIAYTTCV